MSCKYSAVIYDDIANGEGVGAVLFMQGCSHHCKGCHNPQTWDFESGYELTEDVLNNIFDYINNPFVSRLTLSGGDPLDNYESSYEIAKKFKQLFPNKELWLFTGYTMKELYDLQKDDILQYIDVLIDGPFIESERDITLEFRGSKNQNLYKKVQNKWEKQ